jgi:hypothetical protein
MGKIVALPRKLDDDVVVAYRMTLETGAPLAEAYAAACLVWQAFHPAQDRASVERAIDDILIRRFPALGDAVRQRIAEILRADPRPTIERPVNQYAI